MRFLTTRVATAAGIGWLMMLVLVVSSATAAAQTQPEPAAEQAQDEPAGDAEITSAEKLRMEQELIRDKYLHFYSVLDRIAQLTEGTDPRRAALIRKAQKEIGERMVNERLTSLVAQLERDQLSRAIENQEILGEDFRALLELLMSEDRSKRIGAEKARIRAYLN